MRVVSVQRVFVGCHEVCCRTTLIDSVPQMLRLCKLQQHESLCKPARTRPAVQVALLSQTSHLQEIREQVELRPTSRRCCYYCCYYYHHHYHHHHHHHHHLWSGGANQSSALYFRVVVRTPDSLGPLRALSSSSFLGLPDRILNINHNKELLRGRAT